MHISYVFYRKGENGGKVGLFPSSCVAEITASIPKQESENNATTAVDKPKIAVCLYTSSLSPLYTHSSKHNVIHIPIIKYLT